MTSFHSLTYFHLINGIFLFVKIFSFDKKICSIKSRDPRRHGHKAFMARSQSFPPSAIFELFFCKKIPLSRRVGYVMGGSVGGSVRDVCMTHQSDWIYY